MTTVIFDVDGTLSDPTHRLHHLGGDRKDYAAFYGALSDDGCHDPIRNLLRCLSRENRIVICSGRPDDYREATEAWLTRYGIEYTELYLRPSGDFRPDYVIKAEILRAIRADGYDPWLVIDDRPSVVRMWREEGLTCLQCRDWTERETAAKPGLLTLMVGPSGAGKTSWLTALMPGVGPRSLGIEPDQIISSDTVRRYLLGDCLDQTQNGRVFAALHAVVRSRVRAGLPTVVDATNVRRRDRMAVTSLAPPEGRVRYVVIDRPMAEKRRDAGWRAEVKNPDGSPNDVIGRHDQVFKSNLRDILNGDDLPNVEVIDLRRT